MSEAYRLTLGKFAALTVSIGDLWLELLTPIRFSINIIDFILVFLLSTLTVVLTYVSLTWWETHMWEVRQRRPRTIAVRRRRLYLSFVGIAIMVGTAAYVVIARPGDPLALVAGVLEIAGFLMTLVILAWEARP